MYKVNRLLAAGEWTNATSYIFFFMNGYIFFLWIYKPNKGFNTLEQCDYTIIFINIYHKGCGTMGVLCSQAKILNLHLRLILKNTSGKISWSHTNYMRLRHQKHGSWIIFFKEKLTHVKPLPQSIYIYTLRGLIFAWINFCECRPRKISRRLIFANGQA